MRNLSLCAQSNGLILDALNLSVAADEQQLRLYGVQNLYKILYIFFIWRKTLGIFCVFSSFHSRSSDGVCSFNILHHVFAIWKTLKSVSLFRSELIVGYLCSLIGICFAHDHTISSHIISTINVASDNSIGRVVNKEKVQNMNIAIKCKTKAWKVQRNRIQIGLNYWSNESQFRILFRIYISKNLLFVEARFNNFPLMQSAE